MSHMRMVRSREPIRLFESSVLEFFTHIDPAVVLGVSLPVAGYSLYRAALIPTGLGLRLSIGLISGLFAWTWVECAMHRFVFHFSPRTPWQERLSFTRRPPTGGSGSRRRCVTLCWAPSPIEGVAAGELRTNARRRYCDVSRFGLATHFQDVHVVALPRRGDGVERLSPQAAGPAPRSLI